MKRGMISCVLVLLPMFALASQNVVLTSDHLKVGMSSREVAELSELNSDLRALRDSGQMEQDPDVRTVLVEEFQRLKRERDQRFAYARGIVGQTLTLHGEPPPSAHEVVASVVRARKTNSGDGILHAHWSRGPNGELVGGADSPQNNSFKGPLLPPDPSDLPLRKPRPGDAPTHVYGIPTH